MKTVLLYGKKVKFGELNDGAIFVDGLYPDTGTIFIKTGESLITDAGFAVCLYSAIDICVEGVSYSFLSDYEVIALDLNLNFNMQVFMKKEGLRRLYLIRKKRQKPQIKGGR